MQNPRGGISPECHDDDQGNDGALQEALADAGLLRDNRRRLRGKKTWISSAPSLLWSLHASPPAHPELSSCLPENPELPKFGCHLMSPLGDRKEDHGKTEVGKAF